MNVRTFLSLCIWLHACTNLTTVYALIGKNYGKLSDEAKTKCVMQRLGTKWFCISDFAWRRWSGASPLDWLPAKADGARSTHRWLRMHQPLTSFSPPAEADCRGVATVIPNSFLGARSESWVLGEDQCSRQPQRMLLSGLQRYYLSLDTPYTPGSWVRTCVNSGGKLPSTRWLWERCAM